LYREKEIQIVRVRELEIHRLRKIQRERDIEKWRNAHKETEGH
jgi:hypothetical protein